MNKKILLISFLIIALFQGIRAQNGTIKGFVYDASNGEPVAYSTIQLLGTSFGAMSERNGSFIIDKLPDGEYVLQIMFIGYDLLKDTLSIKGGKMVIKRYSLQHSLVSLEAVNVSAAAQRSVQETRTSVISITPKEMAKMPAIGGQPDFAQYLQVLPGIISTGDQGGQLYIRGGTPIQNMLLLDGMLVFNPFHSIGLFSVFDMDIMSNADVYTGGYGAEFGGRISSVMDIQTRDGNKKRVAGEIEMNTFGAKLLLEGPFIKMNNNRKVSFGYLLSAKGSYLEKSAKIFYPYLDKMSHVEGLPYNYLDLYGKISLATQNGTKWNLFGFRFDDMVNYTSATRFGWTNWGVGTNFLIVPGPVPTTIEGTISYSNYTTFLNETMTRIENRESTISGFTANLKFNYYVGKSILNVGFDLQGFTTRYTVDNTEKNDNSTDVAIFLKYKYNWRDILLIEPGFRLQYYASQGAASPEPRLAFKYNITKKIRLKLAGGLYSQNFIGIASDRDVVNLFSGYLSSISTSSTAYADEAFKEKNNTLQKAQHVVLGIELDVIKNTRVNIEGYYKNFSQLVVGNRYKMYDSNSTVDVDDLYKKDFLWEKGRAFGGDISVKFERKGFYAWMVYSLGWVKKDDGIQKYAPHFDRRHNLNVLLSYAFGKRSSWQVDLRWNFGSGFPYTQISAYYPSYIPTGSIGDDYVHANEELEFLLADLNEGRLPNYHRMDMSVKKVFYLGERQTIDLSFSLTNIYNYSNIFYVNRFTNEIIYQLPILYNIGLSWSF